ncbi:MAG: YvcK family protein [Simkaniaceae bacterium]|nr:YvcK family protein [Simkaniaceae bacterium]
MKKIVVMGGGTGNFTVLRGLKNYDLDLSAIVSMADDGGSTGILRDELGVLPPGDVRQCLVALSNSSILMRNLMNYRFENGGLGGHSVGNLLLSSLEKVTGSFEKAIEEVGRILYIKGKVIPVTTHEVRLKMVLKDRRILEGEGEIYLSEEIDRGYESIYLEPFPKANPRALEEIERADLIVMGPGGLHTSIIPNLLVRGLSRALRATTAKSVFICNLMNRKGQTTGFAASDYHREVVRFIGEDIFDHILVNSEEPEPELIEKYAREGELVKNDMVDPRVISTPLLGKIAQKDRSDPLLTRSLIRHDSERVTKELLHIVGDF